MTSFSKLKIGQTVQLRDLRVVVIETIYKQFVKFEEDDVFYLYSSECKHSGSFRVGPNSKFDILKLLSKKE